VSSSSDNSIRVSSRSGSDTEEFKKGVRHQKDDWTAVKFTIPEDVSSFKMIGKKSVDLKSVVETKSGFCLFF
jgi:hypothetical protein